MFRKVINQVVTKDILYFQLLEEQNFVWILLQLHLHSLRELLLSGSSSFLRLLSYISKTLVTHS